MGRKPNPKRRPLSTYDRVKLHRRRKALKNERTILLNERFNQIQNRDNSENNACCENQETELRAKIRNWVNSNHISRRAVDKLLNILNSCGIRAVPKNHRTLLETPIKIKINVLAGGEFWYNGLEKCLKQIFCKLDRDIEISLNINIDGLRIYNSSPICLHPILASIHGSYTYK